MKTKKYIENIKLLINSNFFFLEDLNSCSNNLSQKSINFNFRFLHLSEYIKNLKQLTRILQFLRNQTNSILYLESDRKILDEIFNLVGKKKSNKSLKFLNKFFLSSEEKKKTKNVSKLYLYMNQNSFTNKYFKFLFFHNFYLINSVNTNFEKNNLGFYKLYNDLTTIKKQMFFLLILKKNKFIKLKKII